MLCKQIGIRIRLLSILCCAANLTAIAQQSLLTTSRHTTQQEALDHLLQHWVDSDSIPGAAYWIGDLAGNRWSNYFGVQDWNTQIPLGESSIFRLASMTKLVTAVGLLKLIEAGKGKLEDPLEKYLPEFGGVKVLDSLGLRSPNRKITVRDVLRHTTGWLYGGEAYKAAGVHDRRDYPDSLAVFTQRLASVPLSYDPGTRWNYSFAAEIQGRLIEVLSGKPLRKYFKEEIFAPLDMERTDFFLAQAQKEDLVSLYERKDQQWLKIDFPDSSAYTLMPKLSCGGNGLVAPIADYARLLEMLLHEGRLGETALLSPKTVLALRTNQVPALESDLMRKDAGFGLGVGVTKGTDSPKDNTLYWSGAFNSYFFIDYEQGRYAIFMAQILPYGYAKLMHRFFQVLHSEE